MQEFKGTPGPWRLEEEDSSDHGIDAVSAIDPKDGLQFEVCEVWGIDHDMSICEVSRSNARLIAAAPDLLEALRIARDYVAADLEHRKQAFAGYPQKWETEERDLAAIDAAIAKALNTDTTER